MHPRHTGLGPAINPSPSEGAVAPTPPAALGWSGAPGANSYDVILDGQTVARGLTTTSWTIDRPIGEGRHTWSVTSHGVDATRAGFTWNFGVGAPPVAPADPTPGDMADQARGGCHAGGSGGGIVVLALAFVARRRREVARHA